MTTTAHGRDVPATTGGAAGALDGRALRQHIVESLRREIIEGTVRPGTRLLERDLSARFEVSRVPVREAIITLAGEGLLEVRPRAGAVVAPLTRKQVRETFEIRAALEPMAARLCAARADSRQIREFRRLTEEALQAERDHDDLRGSQANADFHDLLFRAAGNDLLSTMVRPLQGITRRVFRHSIVDHESMMSEDHHDISRAIELGDGDRAEALTLEHLEHTRRHTFDLFDPDDLDRIP